MNLGFPFLITYSYLECSHDRTYVLKYLGYKIVYFFKYFGERCDPHIFLSLYIKLLFILFFS